MFGKIDLREAKVIIYWTQDLGSLHMI